MSASSYDKLKNKLLNLKSSIDKTIQNKGLVDELVNYEQKLNEIYEKLINLQLNPQDKKFISFNFYSAQSYIYLAKGWKFKSIKSYIIALIYYLQYVANLSDQTKWDLRYYIALKKFIISNTKIELFGNTKDNTYNGFMSKLEKLVNTVKEVTLDETIRKSAFELIIDLFYSILADSSELYSVNHLNRADKIKKLMELLGNENLDNYQQGILRSTIFILLKRKLHFYLRQKVPSNHFNASTNADSQEEIKKLIDNMERISNLALKSFKKINSLDEKINFRKFLSELDQLSVEYYKNLWVHGDFIKTFKSLEKIFTHIRKNISFVHTSNIFTHFAIEYEMLINYYKLHLLSRDFEALGNRRYIQPWQKDISLKVAENLRGIANSYYKYEIAKNTERVLLVAERATSGRFIEFIVLYLLKEFVEKNVKLTDHLQQEEHDKNLREFFHVLDKVKHKNNIKWGYKIKGVDSDIDVLIEISTTEKYGLFIKSGILNSKDLGKIRKEIILGAQIKLNKIFIAIDIAKNLRVVENKEFLQDKNIVLVDVGDLLKTLLNVAKKEKDVEFELSKSGVLTYAGFYS
ncbi:MAG: hypothetical protein LWW94_01975 [Candidatus Desulfofervidaceae bacterium]|nr:hypothetical protein [Candidatus Desulfofervidaceae bacterium]